MRNLLLFATMLIMLIFTVRTAWRVMEFGYYFGVLLPVTERSAQKLEAYAARQILGYELRIVAAERAHSAAIDRKLMAQEKETWAKAYSEAQLRYVCDATRFTPDACEALAQSVRDAEWNVHEAERAIEDAREMLEVVRKIAHQAGISTAFLDTFRVPPPRSDEERRRFTPAVARVIREAELNFLEHRARQAERMRERDEARERYQACLAHPPERVRRDFLERLRKESEAQTGNEWLAQSHRDTYAFFKEIADNPCRELKSLAEGGSSFIDDGEEMLQILEQRLVRLRTLALQYGIDPAGQSNHSLAGRFSFSGLDGNRFMAKISNTNLRVLTSIFRKNLSIK